MQKSKKPPPDFTNRPFLDVKLPCLPVYLFTYLPACLYYLLPYHSPTVLVVQRFYSCRLDIAPSPSPRADESVDSSRDPGRLITIKSELREK